jgi:hypothetical protein
MTEWIAWLGVVLVVVPAALFYLLQHRIVFAPNYYPHRSIFLERANSYRLQTLKADDRITLEGVVYEPEGSVVSTVLYFGGREQDSVALIGKFSLHYPQVRFIAFNYRGYGKSEGVPSCQSVYSDALKVYDAMRDEYGDIGVLGYSLGSSIAAHLGRHRRPKWIALVSSFSSVETLMKERLPVLPRFLVRCKYDTLSDLKETLCPIYLFASRDDAMVPLTHFNALKFGARNLAEAKEFSGYNHASLLFSEELEAELKKVFGI